jgi:hypothetical protein
MDRIMGSPADRLAADAGPTFATGMQAWWVAAAEVQLEMMTFLSHQLARNVDAAREILGSKNPADIVDIQSRWAQEMLGDYSAEMTKILTRFAQPWTSVLESKR